MFKSGWLSTLVVFAVCAALVLGCTHKGVRYENNQQWTERSLFTMRCVISPNGSWRTEVIECITPGAKFKIAVNSSAIDGQVEWICRDNGQGFVTLRQEVNKNADCPGGHRRGEVWTEKSFQFECGEAGHTRFLGCLTNSGKIVNPGDSVEVDDYIMTCHQFPNGTLSFTGRRRDDLDCVDKQGAKRAKGSVWVEDQYFQFRCADYGTAQMVGCYYKGNLMPFGTTRAIEGVNYQCEKVGAAVTFKQLGRYKRQKKHFVLRL